MGVNNNIISDNSFLFKEGVASQSFDADANLIKAGKKRDRIQLVKDDDRFSIAVNLIKSKDNNCCKKINDFKANIAKKSGYIKIKLQDGGRLLIDIKSLKSRLHLSDDEINEIKKNAKEGKDIHDLLKKRAELISDVFEKQKIIMKHSGSDPNNISTDVMNVLKATYKENLSINFKFGTNNYLMNLSEEGQSYLFEISQKLGNGTYGDVYSLKDITNADSSEEIVMKFAKNVSGAGEDVKNEFSMLQQIHNEQNVWGIQAKPSQFVILGKGENECGYLGKKYSANYEKYKEN